MFRYFEKKMNALFLCGPDKGHFNPSVYLIEKVLSFGYSITYYVAEDFVQELKKFNIIIKIIPYKIIVTENNNPLIHILGTFKDFLLPLINLLKEDKTKYDIIITDSFIDGCGIAKRMNIPKVISVYSTQGKIYGEKYIEELKNETNDYENVIKKFSDATNGAVSLNLKKDGFFIKNSFLNHYSNESNFKLICSSKLLQKDSDKLEENYLYIGPYEVKRKPNNSYDFDLDLKNLKKEKEKIIYFSLGTQANIFINKEFPYKILKALDKIKGIKVIASLKNNKEEIPKFSDNILIYNYVPQLEVLKYCDLCITHGGYNTVNESLFFSVPLIIIPLGADQPLNAQLIEDLKCGIKINVEDVNQNENIIAESVNKILSEDIFKEQAKFVSKSLKDALAQSEEILKKILS